MFPSVYFNLLFVYFTLIQDFEKKRAKEEAQRAKTRKEQMKEAYRSLGKEEKRRMIEQGRALPDAKRSKGGARRK